jgi:hypothetical protein
MPAAAGLALSALEITAMKPIFARMLAAAWLAAGASAAHAQDQPQAPIPFEGGTLTITENEDGTKVLAFNGKELASNYLVLYDKTVEVAGTKVALVAVGDGGNACGPAEMMIWKPQGGEIKTDTVGEDCGAPPAAVTENSIYFVPYLLPGDTNTVEMWTPDHGVEVVGTIAYAPQPGTDWKDFDGSKLEYLADSMKNAAIYAAAQKLLGNHLLDVMTALGTGGETQKTPSGIFWASGCIPHACGGGDGFMAIDPRAKKLYFAQQGDDPDTPDSWPDHSLWPVEIRALMARALIR